MRVTRRFITVSSSSFSKGGEVSRVAPSEGGASPPVTGTSLKGSSDGAIRIIPPSPKPPPVSSAWLLNPLAASKRGQSGEIKLSTPPPHSTHPHPHPHQMHSVPPPPTHEVRRTRSQVTIAPSILKINLAREMSYSIIHCVIFARKLILIQCDKEN